MIRVLVVDDSAVVRELLSFILNSDPDVEVIGAVGNGEEAVAVVQRVQPDVVTMDVHMPVMDGFEATRRIMEVQPTPIIIVSGSWDTQEVEGAFHALEAGALMAVARPPGPGHPGHEEAAGQIVRAIKAMSEVKVVRRWPRDRFKGDLSRRLTPQTLPSPRAVEVVAVGASTGGPVVLQTLLGNLPADFPVPILVVQHIAAGFVQGFTEWLSQTCGRPVLVAAHGTMMMPGHTYVAPDAHQMSVDHGGKIILSRSSAEHGLCPSVSHLFRSVAEVYGKKAVGVLLTGMGKDGAEELKLMRDRGGYTFAQDEESSVIHGMPGSAIRLDAAMHIMPPERIAATLAALVK